jgi:hypothetical protein
MPQRGPLDPTCGSLPLGKVSCDHHATERVYPVFYQLLRRPEDIKLEIWKGLKGYQ